MPTPACAVDKIALVIGNNRYTNLPASEQLQKAVNDAGAISLVLGWKAFHVIKGENLTRQVMLARLDEAAQRVSPGAMVFFFFSGHGIAIDGSNYILPTDIPLPRTGQTSALTGSAIREEDIIERFVKAGAGVTIFVLDACRNNPFASSGTKGIGGERGLSPHEPPTGVFALYAAGRGETALDRLYDGDKDTNSVFTRALLPLLLNDDFDLPRLAVEVRNEVTRLARSANHIQRPAYYDETSGGQIFISPGGPRGPAPPPRK